MNLKELKEYSIDLLSKSISFSREEKIGLINFIMNQNNKQLIEKIIVVFEEEKINLQKNILSYCKK